MTVKELLDDNKGVGPGFDALRLILSMLVILWHSVYVSYGPGSPERAYVAAHPFFSTAFRAVLPMFFCLSGFLVAGSALRLRRIAPFMTFRVLRILPALFVEVTLCAVVLGAVFTQLPLGAYFSSEGFREYFFNILGYVHFRLPGVFEDSPSPVVNINLWTLPHELYCYVIMGGLIVSGAIFDRKKFLFAFALGTIAYLPHLALDYDWGDAGAVSVNVNGTLFVYSFCVGTLIYLFAERIVVREGYMLLSIASLALLGFKYTIFLGVLGACYLTICIGFMNLRNFPLVRRGDYSYGLYLYGFPIEQALWHMFPFLREWWLLFIVALPCALLFSMVSWHGVEKPFLGLKNRIGYMRKKTPPTEPAPVKPPA